MAEEDGVDLEKVVDGFRLVDKESESVYCWGLMSSGGGQWWWWPWGGEKWG